MTIPKRRVRRPTGSQQGVKIGEEAHDAAFWGRVSFHEPVGWTSAAPRLPDSTFQFSPVRILTPEGECVRVVSVDELNARPQSIGWEPKEPGYEGQTKRSHKRKHVVGGYLGIAGSANVDPGAS